MRAWVMRTVATVAALPMMLVGTGTLIPAAMADDVTEVPLASFTFNGRDNGFVSDEAKAVPQGTVSLVDGNDGTKAAKLGPDSWLNITADDGSSLLRGLDDVTISYDSKPDESANKGWTVFAAPNTADQVYGAEHYLGILDTTSGVTVERYSNNGNTRDTSGNLSFQDDNNGWKHVELVLSDSGAKLSVDGKLVDSNSSGAKLSSILGESDGVLQIGRSNWSSKGAYEGYSGLVDNLRITTTPQAAANQVASRLDLGNTSNVTSDLALPKTAQHNSKVSWTSSQPTIIDSDGTVSPGASDTQVTLTAKVTVDGATATRHFDVTVPAAATTATQAADRLLVPYQLADGERLPDTVSGAKGSTVTWQSDDANLVDRDGIVHGTSDDKEKSTDMTAIIRLNGETDEKTFTGLRVMPKNASVLATYTRDATVDGGARVGNALHLALDTSSGYEALNTNYGVAFAEARIVEGGKNDKGYPTQTTSIRGLVDPYLFRMKDGGYAYVGVFTDEGGTRVDGGSIAFSTSKDLVEWSGNPNNDERGDMVTVSDDDSLFDAGTIAAGYDASARNYRISWEENGIPEYVTTTDFKTFSDVQKGVGFTRSAVDLSSVPNAVPGNVLAVDASLARSLANKLGRVTNTSVENPTITVAKGSSKAELLKKIKGGEEQKDGTFSKGSTLKADYTDGSSFQFRVDWDENQLDKIDTSKIGDQSVSGTAIQQNYSNDFPMMKNRADPNIEYWKGKYYAMGTSDVGGQRSLFIRSSATLAGLKDQKEGVQGNGGYYVEGQDTFLFGDNDGFGHTGYHWAPELHAIKDSNGKEHLYCFYATVADASYESPNWAGPVAYVMELKDGGDPTKTADWIEHRALNKDGGNLSDHGLSIDMTYFEVNGKSYIAWSQGDEKFAGAKANVSIAEVSCNEPWKALTVPARISRPEWGWELDGVNEGPNALVSGDKVYMVFSAQQVSPRYATGMLIADVGADLTQEGNWTKSNYPWMHNGVFPGQYGLGHNSFFSDPYGDVYNVYHAMTSDKSTTNRHAGIVPVHFRSDGSPIIDMRADEELKPAFAQADAVKLTVKVVDDAVSDDATLRSLTIANARVNPNDAASPSGSKLTLNDPETVTVKDVLALPNDANASVKVTVVDSVVTVTVTAQDGITTKTYIVTLNKNGIPKPAPSGPADSGAGGRITDSTRNGTNALRTRLPNTGIRLLSIVVSAFLLVLLSGVAISMRRKWAGR